MAEPEKKTVMVLKVDHQCPCCYKKIQKILCRIPQIRDRVFDEKENTVTITVICCSPEKIREKLWCKGCKIIKSIVIKEPLKEKPKSNGKVNAPPPEPKPPKNPAPEPPVRLPPVYPCCGPCYHGCGFQPPPPQPCCDGNYACGPIYVYGRPPCYVTRRCDYFSEENATGCRIM